MIDPKSQDLWHVILTPTGVQSVERINGMEHALSGGLPLEVCSMEPVGLERAQELIELFARMSVGGEAAYHEHGADAAPCPICSPSQRDLVASAVRRAFQDDPW